MNDTSLESADRWCDASTTPVRRPRREEERKVHLKMYINVKVKQKMFTLTGPRPCGPPAPRKV